MKNISLLKRLCDVLLAPPIYCSSNLLYPYTNICTVYMYITKSVLKYYTELLYLSVKKNMNFLGLSKSVCERKDLGLLGHGFFNLICELQYIHTVRATVLYVVLSPRSLPKILRVA